MPTEETRLLEWLNRGRPTDMMITEDEFLPGGAPRRLPGLLGDFMGAFGGTPDTSQGLIGAAQGMAYPGYHDPVTSAPPPPGAGIPPPTAPPGPGGGIPGIPGIGGLPGAGMPPASTGATEDPIDRALKAVMMYQSLSGMGRIY